MSDTNERVPHCRKCNATFSWADYIWSISVARGYKGKVHVCECGEEQALLVPVSKEKKAAWELLRP